MVILPWPISLEAHMDITPELLKAYTRFQGLCPPIAKVGKNTFQDYNYAKLDDMNSIIKPLLSRCDLLIIHVTTESDQCITRLYHIEGGYFEAISILMYSKNAKQLQQEWGKALSYCKRYNTSSILNLICGDQDFDAYDSEAEIDVIDTKEEVEKIVTVQTDGEESDRPELIINSKDYYNCLAWIKESSSVGQAVDRIQSLGAERFIISDDLNQDLIDNYKAK